MITISQRSDSGHIVCTFDGDENLQEIYDLQDSMCEVGHEDCIDQLVYISLDGTEDTYLNPKRYAVTNPKASLINHCMWNQIFDEKEQAEEIEKIVQRFIETGDQIIIEDYEFVEDEPFYDYGGYPET